MNFSSELEVLVKEVNSRIFSNISHGYRDTQKSKAWDSIMCAVIIVSGEGHTVAEINCEIRQQKTHHENRYLSYPYNV